MKGLGQKDFENARSDLQPLPIHLRFGIVSRLKVSDTWLFYARGTSKLVIWAGLW